MEAPANLAATPHRKRLRRADVPGDARFLTFSCFRRQPFLSRQRSCGWFLDALERSRETHGLHLWALVLMPEHVHLLIYPGYEAHRVADMHTQEIGHKPGAGVRPARRAGVSDPDGRPAAQRPRVIALLAARRGIRREPLHARQDLGQN